MPEPGVGSGNGSQIRRVASNRLDPERMAADERLAEVGALLARGLLRCRLRAAGRREKNLDNLRPSSDSCLEPSSGGRET
jgi:hypothetical protein